MRNFLTPPKISIDPANGGGVIMGVYKEARSRMTPCST